MSPSNFDYRPPPSWWWWLFFLSMKDCLTALMCLLHGITERPALGLGPCGSPGTELLGRATPSQPRAPNSRPPACVDRHGGPSVVALNLPAPPQSCPHPRFLDGETSGQVVGLFLLLLLCQCELLYCLRPIAASICFSSKVTVMRSDCVMP